MMQAIRIHHPWRQRHVPDLPWDVVFLILDRIPISSLPTLILACQAFRQIGEIVLYRHIDLTNSPIRSLLLFRTVIESPYLAGLVRTFQMAEQIKRPKGFTKLANRVRRIPTPNHYHRLRELTAIGDIACKRLKNAEAISVQSSIGDLRSLFPQAKKLRLLRIGQYPESASRIHSLPDLTHLEIPITSLFVQDIMPLITSDHTPNLRELVAPTSIATQMVPGRPLERLFLIFPLLNRPPAAFDLMSAMHKSTAKITVLGLVLGFGWEFEARDVLQATGMFLNDIEELYLRFRFSWGRSIESRTSFLEALTDLLRAQPSLRILDLNGSTGEEIIPYLDCNRRALSSKYVNALKGWKEVCPTLDRVIFPNGSIWLYQETSGKWRCQNGWAPGRNRIRRQFYTRVDGAEPWSTPMFRKDLKRDWPDDLVAKLKMPVSGL